MSVTADQIARAKTHGLVNVEHLAAACDRHRFPFYLGCTILQKESGGKNIFGHDRGGAFSVPGQNIEVTEQRYREFRSQIGAGKTSNGVGPMQITWKGFFPDMESKGLKPWVPADNISYGTGLLAEDYHRARKAGRSIRSAFRSAATQYNGAKVYGVDAVAKSVLWKARVGTADLDGPAAATSVAATATTTSAPRTAADLADLLRRRPLTKVSVDKLNRARHGRYLSRYVGVVQDWLGMPALTGRWSDADQEAYDAFRRSLGWTGDDVVGDAGISSLARLAEHAKQRGVKTYPLTK